MRGGKRPHYAKRYGTPTQSPTPQGIDSWSGFKVNLSDLKRQWDGNYSFDPDRRNPQDFVRGVKDDPSLPFARPEAPAVFVAGNIVWESGAFMTGQEGEPLLTQGIDPGETL